MSYELTGRLGAIGGSYGGFGAVTAPTNEQIFDEMCPPWTDPRQITTKPLCGNAKAVQGALRDLGHYGGPIDGQFGSGTVAAIKKFKAEHGLGGVAWTDPAFCAKLREMQEYKVSREYDIKYPPVDPQTGQPQPIDPGTGQPVQTQPPVSPPVDNTRTYLMIGGFGITAVIAIALIAYAAKQD